MANYKQTVTKIELKDGEKGPYKLVTFKKKDGTTKERKVWGDLAAAFTQAGQYEATFDDTTHYLTGAKFLGGSTGAPGTGVSKVEGERSRSIQSQCAAKAAAAVLAGYAQGGMASDKLLAMVPVLTHAFMEAIDKADAPAPKAEEIEVSPF